MVTRGHPQMHFTRQSQSSTPENHDQWVVQSVWTYTSSSCASFLCSTCNPARRHEHNKAIANWLGVGPTRGYNPQGAYTNAIVHACRVDHTTIVYYGIIHHNTNSYYGRFYHNTFLYYGRFYHNTHSVVLYYTIACCIMVDSTIIQTCIMVEICIMVDSTMIHC